MIKSKETLHDTSVMLASNMLSSLPPKQEQPEKSTGGALWEKLGPGTKSTESDQHHFEQGGRSHHYLSAVYGHSLSIRWEGLFWGLEGLENLIPRHQIS